MTLKTFTVAHETDGGTVCSIIVAPPLHRCDVMVTVAGRIVVRADETESTFRAVTSAEWYDFSFWECKASAIAKAHSPFWKGETAE